jgi:phosphoenolpyruvate carboxylase
MKIKTMIIGMGILAVNGASASTLTRSLEQNVYQAQATLRQEKSRYDYARTSYNASKEKLRTAEVRLKKAKADELKEEQQLRAIENANARYYEIPKYGYNSGGTDVSWRTR